MIQRGLRVMFSDKRGRSISACLLSAPGAPNARYASTAKPLIHRVWGSALVSGTKKPRPERGIGQGS
jgi:hypothetical protein